MTEKPNPLPNILNFVAQGVALYDNARNLVFWNDQYEQILRFPTGLLRIGLPVSDVIMAMAERGDYGAGDSISLVQERVEELWRGLDTQRQITIADETSEFGEYTYELCSELTENNELVITWTDVTARDRLEHELRESREQFRDFAESSSDWLWETDSNLRFTYFSPNITRVLGVTPEWHYGKTRRELLGNDYDRDLWDAHLQAQQERRPFRDFTYYRVGESIKPIWLSTSGVPVFDADGDFKGYRGTGTDVTERKAVEALLIQKDKLATLGTLSAGMAHELSQPLNIIRLMVDSIMYDVDDSDEQCNVETKDMKQIVSQVMRMAEIIDHMRIFSRKEAVSSEAFMPAVSVAAALRLVENQFTASNIELETRVPATSGYIHGSSSKLEQVVLNLLANARDAIATHSEKLANEEFQGKIVVELTDDEAQGKIVISIFNNGEEIDDDIFDKIFDPFFTTKDAGKGTGLGLSVSYTIIESMGGKLEAQNVTGGVCFWITLSHKQHS